MHDKILFNRYVYLLFFLCKKTTSALIPSHWLRNPELLPINSELVTTILEGWIWSSIDALHDYMLIWYFSQFMILHYIYIAYMWDHSNDSMKFKLNRPEYRAFSLSRECLACQPPCSTEWSLPFCFSSAFDHYYYLLVVF